MPRGLVQSCRSYLLLSNMFRDPFYYGILLQSNQTVNLCELTNFQPLTTKDMYDAIQVMSRGRTQDKFTKKRVTFYPLHAFVYCAVCNNSDHMIVGKNKNGSGKHVLSYRCSNKSCTRKVKSFRAKYVFDSIYDMLADLDLTDAGYKRYSDAIDSMTDSKIVEIKEVIFSKGGMLTHIKKEVNERSLTVGRMPEGSTVYRANMERLEELATQQRDLEDQIGKLSKKIANPARIKLSKEEFLNVIKTAADKMKAGSAVEKDALCRILFLNVRVDDEKVVEYLWKEPFNELVNMAKINSGGGGWNRTNYQVVMSRLL
jgi:ACT domain-containing protein